MCSENCSLVQQKSLTETKYNLFLEKLRDYRILLYVALIHRKLRFWPKFICLNSVKSVAEKEDCTV